MEVDVALGLRRPRVRRRAELADQGDLLERGGELGAGRPPFDALEPVECRLDGRALAVALEVRAQPGPQVARLADVEHAAVAVAEEVDAGSARRAADEVALAVDPPRARGSQLLELGDRRGAALLRDLDEPEEHLGGRLGIGERAVAGLDGGAEEVRERGEARPLDPPAQEVARERHRVDDGRREPFPGQAFELAVDEADVEAGVVGDEDGVAGEGDEAGERLADSRRAAQLVVGEPGQPPDRTRQRHARRDERLEDAGRLEPSQSDRADLADPGRGDGETRRLEIEDDEARLGEVRVGRARERDERAAPGKPRITVDERTEQRAGDAVGDARKQRRAAGPHRSPGACRRPPRRARRAGRANRSRAAPAAS